MFERIDRPETWIALHGLLAAFAWEMFQMPFYAMDQLSVWQVTKSCGLASFGDAGIMVFAYWIASLSAGNRWWIQTAAAAPLAAYLVAGLSVTIAVEYFALRGDWGWQYSDMMPVIMGVGLVPLVMWIIVPLIALKLAKRSFAGSKSSSASII